MKKKSIYKFLYIISILLILVFTIILCSDYLKYNPYETSAPFYTFIIIRTAEFLIPSILIFFIAKIIKTKMH